MPHALFTFQRLTSHFWNMLLLLSLGLFGQASASPLYLCITSVCPCLIHDILKHSNIWPSQALIQQIQSHSPCNEILPIQKHFWLLSRARIFSFIVVILLLYYMIICYYCLVDKVVVAMLDNVAGCCFFAAVSPISIEVNAASRLVILVGRLNCFLSVGLAGATTLLLLLSRCCCWWWLYSSNSACDNRIDNLDEDEGDRLPLPLLLVLEI